MSKLRDENRHLLVVAAHPDDEILGCGATVRLRVNQGWRAHLIIMSGGITGRMSTVSQTPELQAERAELVQQVQRAADVVGFESVTVLDFPDNRMDMVSRMDLAHALRPEIESLKPALVLTHHPGDYNWDHTRTFDAVMMAARPNPPDHMPAEIWTFSSQSLCRRGAYNRSQEARNVLL
jgi:LmbE family N-acetylglucosaminyl deacetylase